MSFFQLTIHRTMVSHNDDVDAAVKVHLLQSVHQLTDDVVNFPQRVVQLRKGHMIDTDGQINDITQRSGFTDISHLPRC